MLRTDRPPAGVSGHRGGDGDLLSVRILLGKEKLQFDMKQECYETQSAVHALLPLWTLFLHFANLQSSFLRPKCDFVLGLVNN